MATAIYDGADAVMLSAESAAGQYPREAVEMMDRIIRSTEQHKLYRSIIEASKPGEEQTAPHAVAAAAADLAEAIKAPAIIAFTSSGTTAARIARKRPLSRSWRSRRTKGSRAASPSYGALTASFPRMSTRMRKWWIGRPRSRFRKNLRNRRIRWWLLRAFPSGRQGRRTTCASSN